MYTVLPDFPRKIPENFISPGVMAGINGQDNKKKREKNARTSRPSIVRVRTNEFTF